MEKFEKEEEVIVVNRSRKKQNGEKSISGNDYNGCINNNRVNDNQVHNNHVNDNQVHNNHVNDNQMHNNQVNSNQVNSKEGSMKNGRTLIDQETKVFEMPSRSKLNSTMNNNSGVNQGREKNKEDNINRLDNANNPNKYRGNSLNPNKNNNLNKDNINNSYNKIKEKKRIANSENSMITDNSKSQNKTAEDIKGNTEKDIEVIRKGNIEKNNIEKNTSNSINSDRKIDKSIDKIIEKKNSDKVEEATRRPKSKKSKKGLVVLLILSIVIVIVIIFSTIFSFITRKNAKIINGVYINNIEVSNLTKQEAITKLESKLNNEEENFITIKHNDDYSRQIHLSECGGKFDVISAVDTAYNLGRGSNIVIENYKILNTMSSNENITVKFSYDEELLKDLIDKISLELPDLVTASSYVVNGDKLIIKNGQDGVRIQQEDFANNLEKTFTGMEKSFEIPVEECQKEEIDIEKIHSEIYKAPVNAYYTTNPYKVVKEENGLDFEMGLDAAKKMLQEDKEEYVIKLKTVKPAVTVNTLNSEAFPDLLSTFTTNYGTGDVARNTNIALAAKSINSVVVMPGEVFSYNDLIGECSTRTGYKESTIYLNGELSRGVGGGICQVSTTLYNTVLRANLEIVERRNHSLSVTYVPLGHDAMVSIGSQDFKFKNNRNYPIKVVATTGTGSITCQIYGLKQDIEYEVKLESKVVSKTDTRTKVQTYKILYLDGVEKSRTLLSTDSYKNH